MHQTTVSRYMKQKLIESKGEMNKFTIIIRDFNASNSETDEINNRQEISKGRENLNNTMEQDLNDTVRILHPTMAKHILFF